MSRPAQVIRLERPPIILLLPVPVSSMSCPDPVLRPEVYPPFYYFRRQVHPCLVLLKCFALKFRPSSCLCRRHTIPISDHHESINRLPIYLGEPTVTGSPHAQPPLLETRSHAERTRPNFPEASQRCHTSKTGVYSNSRHRHRIRGPQLKDTSHRQCRGSRTARRHRTRVVRKQIF